ncbi:hypothetical protein Aple_051000 [Acrocarpospora pleiomorpha]|uniref:Uncharacterized protein n=1 Tax=Acrocarpospora pleiomorpha TaxID=90975 RepID=A0A5M3XSH5_9ACTN|nr:hypothetical protein [Acrocarpospora pleiomorpha]GES22203.1 hypothetical protein Aple_051000 [Acrocarpospora pleiomorpha]
MALFQPRKNQAVPAHRKSRWSQTEGYDVFTASSWTRVGGLGQWTCGYCQKTTTDPLSPYQGQTLADCRECGRSNRISLD